MPFWLRFLIVVWLAIGSAQAFRVGDPAEIDSISASELPVEGRETLRSIKAGGPFPYSRDGIVFGNFEKRLPMRHRGYYREYTVKTPWRQDRGPRRIVAGVPGEYYYTPDHYRTFRKIKD